MAGSVQELRRGRGDESFEEHVEAVELVVEGGDGHIAELAMEDVGRAEPEVTDLRQRFGPRFWTASAFNFWDGYWRGM